MIIEDILGASEWRTWLSKSHSWWKWPRRDSNQGLISNHGPALVSVETGPWCFHSNPSEDVFPATWCACAVGDVIEAPHIVASAKAEVSGAAPEAAGRRGLVERTAAWDSRGG